MKRKGQAAIEFLSTYGWMFLVVVAVIAAMTYYGFGDAKARIPTSCYFGTNFDCGAFMVSSDGNIAFEITNFNDRPIIFGSVAVLYPGTDDYETTDFYGSDPLLVGETRVLYVSLNEELTAETKDKFVVKLFYQFDEVDALDKVASGEIVAQVTDDQVIIDSFKNNPLTIESN